VIGWELCCGVGYKEEAVNGRRVQEIFFGFESTQLARQVHQERTQMEVQY